VEQGSVQRSSYCRHTQLWCRDLYRYGIKIFPVAKLGSARFTAFEHVCSCRCVSYDLQSYYLRM
jgi:hypothetical protein